MNKDELAREPHERLVEVLLEEEFRRTRMVSPRRQNSRWLAAAVVLLGLSVVGGVMVLRGDDDARVVPVQDPQPAPKEPETVALKTYAEFLALAGDVQRIRMDLVKSFGASPAGTKTPFVGLAGATASIEDPAKVRDFVARIPKLADGIHGFQLHEETSGGLLTLELRDGRRIQGGAFFGEHSGFWLSVIGPAFPPPAPLLEVLQDLYAQALANERIAHGITQSLAELARVPTTATTIQCDPLPPGSVAQHLARFPKLERLHFSITRWLGTTSPQAIPIPVPIRLDEYRALPNLRHFRFPGQGLVDMDAAALGRMKNLTSVRIDGGLGDLSEIGARTLVSNLDALELISVKNGNAILRAAIALGRLQKLALFGVEPTRDEFTALLAMPSLRELDLTGIFWTDAHIAELAKSTSQLERLRLRSTEITAAALQQLGALPRLHEIDLRQEGLGGKELDAIAAALPKCRLRRPGEPHDDPWSPDAVPGRTRR